MARQIPFVWVATTVLVAGGCDHVFGIDELPPTPDAPPEIVNYDRCAPIPEDPLRYATVTAPTAEPWSWSDARAACMRRGMDLAVMNDEHEITGASTEASTYWVGATYDGSAWASVDGCPSYVRTQASGSSSQCGYAGDPNGATFGTIFGGTCSGALGLVDLAGDPVEVHAALCESPRPSTGGCGYRKPADEQYVLADAGATYANARLSCQKMGGHLLVIDSLEELHFVAKLAEDKAFPRVWIGATFDRRQWLSDTACPGLYSWTDGTPTFDVSTECLATTMSAGDPDLEEGESAQTLTGMRPERCTDDTVRALCELGDIVE